MTRCERVYDIVKKLSNQHNSTLMQSWEKIFSTNDVFEVYFYLERLHNEICLSEYRKKNYKIIRKDVRYITTRIGLLTF